MKQEKGWLPGTGKIRVSVTHIGAYLRYFGTLSDLKF